MLKIVNSNTSALKLEKYWDFSSSFKGYGKKLCDCHKLLFFRIIFHCEAVLIGNVSLIHTIYGNFFQEKFET